MFRCIRRLSVKVLLGLCACHVGQGISLAQGLPYQLPANSYRPNPVNVGNSGTPGIPGQQFTQPSADSYVPSNSIQQMPVGPTPPNQTVPSTMNNGIPASNPLPSAPLNSSIPVQQVPSVPVTEGSLYPESPVGEVSGVIPVDTGIIETLATGKPWNAPNETIAALGFLGRSEFMNRFNLFENNSALPMNRVWAGFDSMDKFQTGFGTTSTPGLPLTQRRTQNLYRLGFECAPNDWVSFSVQGDYAQATATQNGNDDWTNPLLMAKLALINNGSLIVSPVIGLQIETGQAHGQLHENGSRLIPGLLVFWALSDRLFLQGGTQFSYSFSDYSQTLDYAVSLGYWLYRDSSMDVAGRNRESFRRSAVPFLTGFIPQVDFYGKNVLANATTIPYQIDTPTLPGVSYGPYAEGKNVYDISAGFRMIIMNHFSLMVGYSVPVTGIRVSNQEFTSALNVSW